jgi:hypothetical protein
MGKGFDRLTAQMVAALREHMKSNERVDVPEAGALLWDAFLQLDAARTFHAAGPNPIGFAEIEAWARLMRMPLEPHHVRALRTMDAELLSPSSAASSHGRIRSK